MGNTGCSEQNGLRLPGLMASVVLILLLEDPPPELPGGDGWLSSAFVLRLVRNRFVL